MGGLLLLFQCYGAARPGSESRPHDGVGGTVGRCCFCGFLPLGGTDVSLSVLARREDDSGDGKRPDSLAGEQPPRAAACTPAQRSECAWNDGELR